jgi:hypothetical protein
MPLTNYGGNKVLDALLGAVALGAPATWYFGLFTSMPTVLGTDGTEVSGGSYARIAATNNTTNFPVAVAKAKSNGTAITFPTASAGWGSVLGVGLFDALTVGNCWMYATFASPRTVAISDALSFNTGQLDWTC